MDPGGATYPTWLRPTTSTMCTASAPASVASSKGRLVLPRTGAVKASLRLPEPSGNENCMGGGDPAPPSVHMGTSPCPASALGIDGTCQRDRVFFPLSEVASRPREGQAVRPTPSPQRVLNEGRGVKESCAGIWESGEQNQCCIMHQSHQ